MTPDPHRDQRRTQDRAPDENQSGTDEPDGETERSSGWFLSRRGALLGAGVGLGLLSGASQTAGARRGPQWRRDVDANGNDLLDLGRLNTEAMDDETGIADFAGSNLAIEEGELGTEINLAARRLASLSDTDLDVESDANLDVDAGEDLTGEALEDVFLQSGEDTTVDAGRDLVLSISGSQGSIRIQTEGGHEIVLEDEDGEESVSIEDSAGNSVEMDSTTGEVSISANETISLDAPQIDISADTLLTVDSGGITDIDSAALLNIDGALVSLNGGSFPAARVGDAVEDGVIQTGSTTVLID